MGDTVSTQCKAKEVRIRVLCHLVGMVLLNRSRHPPYLGVNNGTLIISTHYEVWYFYPLPYSEMPLLLYTPTKGFQTGSHLLYQVVVELDSDGVSADAVLEIMSKRFIYVAARPAFSAAISTTCHTVKRGKRINSKLHYIDKLAARHQVIPSAIHS